MKVTPRFFWLFNLAPNSSCKLCHFLIYNLFFWNIASSEFHEFVLQCFPELTEDFLRLSFMIYSRCIRKIDFRFLCFRNFLNMNISRLLFSKSITRGSDNESSCEIIDGGEGTPDGCKTSDPNCWIPENSASEFKVWVWVDKIVKLHKKCKKCDLLGHYTKRIPCIFLS